jgi:NAD(P)-dependent dehydrogenase (short-subunit alcohol dehydrogenase family)
LVGKVHHPQAVDARVAIVTGAAGGLGAAIVRRLLDDGLRVAVADLDAEAARALAARHDDALAVAVDVSDPASAEAMAATVLDAWGRVDVLVNNAGIAGPFAPVSEVPVADWHRVIDVNLNGAFHCTRACLPAILAGADGRIVNVASIAGKDGNANMAAYSASKAGVIALTKSLGKELATAGVLVNCVVPGVIAAGLTDRATDDERALLLSRVPMGRMGEPEELAELASWLASTRCSFSTGATYDLSGGRATY